VSLEGPLRGGARGRADCWLAARAPAAAPRQGWRPRRRRAPSCTARRRCTRASASEASDPAADVSAAAAAAIHADVARHRLLVFRDQGIVSGTRQVEIARWFNELESTFYKHPRSLHPDVFRVSNDPAEGCTGVGRTGWHVDGSFQCAPFAHALYHIVACTPRTGVTAFAPLDEVLAAVPPEARARWERLSMLSDRRSPDAKPLVYSHPETGHDTLLFHTGMTAVFVWDAGTPRARATDARETAALLEEIE
jgi:taurine dioxygenase